MDKKIQMDEDERKVHEAILAFGWDKWKIRWQFGLDVYQGFMGGLNPFAKAYFSLLERYYKAARLLKETQEERDHYKTRYLEIAQNASASIRELSKHGITKDSIHV